MMTLFRASTPVSADEFEAIALRLRALARFPITRAMARRRFSRLIDAQLSAPIVWSEVAGLPVELDLSKGWDRKIYLFGVGDGRAVKTIATIMDKIGCRTAWDVGANRGNHSAVMARHCRRLFSFEPDPMSFPRLSSLLSKAPNAEPVNAALSDVQGEAPFRFHRPGASAHIDASAPDAWVRLETGDAFASQRDIHDLDFMKIDVEGHEISVLRGMRKTIVEQRPIIILEILSRSNVQRAELEACLPDYRMFGNYQDLASHIWMTPFHFGPLIDGRAYTHALAVPIEKMHKLDL